MLRRATQDGQVMVERSDRMWSTGGGNGKPLQYSCLENPMNSMKRQKDRALKEELPRSVGAQHATWDQWRNNSRNSNTLATWCEELTHLKRPWCWERSKAGGEGDDRGWDGWMALSTRWTWIWVDSGNWWWTGRPGVLRIMGLQRVRHDWATELNWTDLQYHIGHLMTWGVHLSVPYLFAFSYCSSGSQGKYTEVLCHSLHQ